MALTVLQKSITVIASGNSGAAGVFWKLGRHHGFMFQVDLTDTDLIAPDVIDIKLQTSVDGGAQWFDVAALPQLNGSTPSGQYLMKIAKAVGEAAHARAVDTIAADSVLNFFGDRWRARWIVGGGTPSFTFSAAMAPF